MSMFATWAISKAIKRKNEARKKLEESTATVNEPQKVNKSVEPTKTSETVKETKPEEKKETKNEVKSESKGNKHLRDE